jgi:hypothetical protein
MRCGEKDVAMQRAVTGDLEEIGRSGKAREGVAVKEGKEIGGMEVDIDAGCGGSVQSGSIGATGNANGTGQS